MNNATRFPAIPVRSVLGTAVFTRTSTYGLGRAAARREGQLLLHAHARPAPEDAARCGIGLWIDHRKAVIVFVSLGGASTTLVLSRVDKQPGRIAGRRSTAPFEPQLVPADDSRDRRHTAQLGLYYDAVIACIRDYDRILAFGPGEAKGELRRRLALNKQDRRVFVFETADKMTGRQIASKTLDWLADGRPGTPAARRRSGRPERGLRR